MEDKVRIKLLRITTIPNSLRNLLKGQHKFLSENGFEVIGVSSSGEALDEIAQFEKIETHVIEMTRSITPFKDLKALFELIRFIRKERPEIVHTHTPKAGLLGMLAAKIAGVPFRLHTVAGMPLTVATGNKRRLLNLMEKLTYSCATNVYPNSFGLRNLILEYKFTRESKLKVIANGSSNGIDTAVFDPTRVSDEIRIILRQNLNIQPEDFVFLFVGRVVGDKGINELVEAFKRLLETGNNIEKSKAHLLIVGDEERSLDPLLSLTQNSIDNHPAIHAVGYQRNVVDYFAISDVLVFPSYREGFPNVVMQAAAMQLNCIVSDINGCNEIITDGDNGWVVPVKNVNILVDRMKWCLLHREESKRMGRKSRAMMKERYERDFVHQELLNEYKSILMDKLV